MKDCIYKVAMGFCLLLKECKCAKIKDIEANPFKYTL